MEKQTTILEETLLPKSPEWKQEESLSMSEEVKRQPWLAGPLIAGNLLQNLIPMISVMLVGHLGELPLAGASVANSFATVTGFSLMQGMATALDTLCGQAYGARQYHLLGIYKQRAMLILTLVSVPVAVLWFYTGSVLLLVGQDEDIAMEAGTYARWMIPALFAYGLVQCQVRFLQTQNIVLPVMLSAAPTALFTSPSAVCWCMASGWAARAQLLATPSPSGSMWSFWPCTLAVPSALMVCLEWWSFEALVLLSGLLPNPELETSVLSITLNTATLVFMIPSGLGAAISDEEEVVAYVAKMLLLIAVSNFFEGIQSVLSGVARGCGWQKIGACINLGAFYLVGIPAAYHLAFVLRVGGMGLWAGIICGSTVQVLLLLAITLRTNWQTEATKAKNRVFYSAMPTDLAT
ncbi:hypothetical protein ACQ4PT_072134 [Festuca glaucescens]